jgi:hypothetical protein
VGHCSRAGAKIRDGLSPKDLAGVSIAERLRKGDVSGLARRRPKR